jgi:hemerythrin-like domain-containing protein
VDKTRRLIAGAGAFVAASATLSLRAAKPAAAERGTDRPGEGQEDVSAPEDLMREHGVLRRILLIYDEISWRRIPAGQDFPIEVVAESAQLVRRFVEDYHEKLEEDCIFPRFRRANRSVELVDTLLAQHRAGRTLTDAVLDRARPGTMSDRRQGDSLAQVLRLFAHMYRPHAAREDTVLFPSLRSIVSGHEFDALGEEFEEREHQLFGPDGFEAVVGRVAALEDRLGISDLANFTASWPAV